MTAALIKTTDRGGAKAMLSDDELDLLMDRMLRPTVPSMISLLIGAGSVCKDWRRAYHRKKSPLDGSVAQVEEDWFQIRGGTTFEEAATVGDVLEDPFSIRVVRENSPGRPVRIFLVRDEMIRGGRAAQRADRIAVRFFVSVFSTKDVHRQVWKAAEFSEDDRPSSVYHAREVEAATRVLLPIVGANCAMWPAVFPDLSRMESSTFFKMTGDIAIHVPSEVGERVLPCGDANNRPAVFFRRILKLAGKFEDYATLNAVPGVLSVDTPTEFQCLHPDGSQAYRQALCDHLRSKDTFLQEPLRAPPPPGGWVLCTRLEGMQEPKKRAAAQEAAEKITNQTNLINATSSTGGLPVALKPSAVQENDEQDGVHDARFDTESEEEDESDDESDLNYAP